MADPDHLERMTSTLVVMLGLILLINFTVIANRFSCPPGITKVIGSLL
jgi:hypothetical protein